MMTPFASARKRTSITYGKSARRRPEYSSTILDFQGDEDELSVADVVGSSSTKRMARRKSRDYEETEPDVEMSLEIDHQASPVVSMIQNSRKTNGIPKKIRAEQVDTSIFDFNSSDDDVPITPMRPTPRRTNPTRPKTPASIRNGTAQTDSGAKDKPNGNGRRVRGGLPTTPAPDPTSRTYRITKPAPPTILRSKSLRTNGHISAEVCELVGTNGSTKSGSSSSEKVVKKGILKNGGTTSTPARTRITRSMSASLEDAPDIVMSGIVYGGEVMETPKPKKKTNALKESQSTRTSTEKAIPKTPVRQRKSTEARPTLQQSSSCIPSIDTEKITRVQQRRVMATTMASTTTATRTQISSTPKEQTSKVIVEASSTTVAAPKSARVETLLIPSNPTRIERPKAPTQLPLQREKRPEAQAESSKSGSGSPPGSKRSHMEFKMDVVLDILEPEQTPRKKIVDRLKMNASINTSNYSDESDSSDQEEDVDVPMSDTSSEPSPIRTESQLAAAIHQMSQDSQAASQSESQRSLPLETQKAVHRQRIGPKITYSRQRSFLIEDAQEDALFSQNMLPGALRALAVKENKSEEELSDDSEDDSQGKAVKSLHELRETGLNQRYVDEINGLFDDIEGDSPLSAKRSGYMELARKLLDKTYVHKFSANGFDQQLLETIGEPRDVIISFAVSSILISLLTHEPTSQTVLQTRKDSILRMLCTQITNGKDIKLIAKERPTNMSKAGISLVVELADEILKAHTIIFTHPPKIISPRLLSAKVLERLTHRIRLLEIKDEFLPSTTTWTLISFLVPFANPVKAIQTYTTTDKNLLSIPLNFLRAYAASDMTFLTTSPDNLASLLTLPTIFTTLKHHLQKEDPKLLETLKELLFIFSNRSTLASEALATRSKLVHICVDEIDLGMRELEQETDLEKRQNKADDVVQTIGTLCGLVQNSGAARDAVLLTRDSPQRSDDWDIDMDDNSSSTATGSKKETYLDVLLNIFNQYYSDTIFTDDNMSRIYIIIVLGYLSILLGTLCQLRSVRTLLSTSLSSSETKKQSTISSLATVIGEFIRANQVMNKMMEDHPEVVERDEGWKGGLSGQEGERQLEEYKLLRERLVIWSREG